MKWGHYEITGKFEDMWVHMFLWTTASPGPMLVGPNSYDGGGHMALNLMTGVNILNAILGGEKLPDNNLIVALAAKGMKGMQQARQAVCEKPKPSRG